MKINLVRVAIILVVLLGVGGVIYPKYFPMGQVKYYPNGQIFEKYQAVNGIKNGPAVTYYANGNVRSEDNYKNGELDGIIKRYYEDGKLFSVNTFSNGLMEGLNEFYHPTGEKRSSEMYKNNVQHGLSRFYFPSGRILEESEFVLGKPNGKHSRYYEDGQVEEVVFFKEGLKHGSVKQYTKDGLPKANHQYQNGKLEGINEWYGATGNIESLGQYTDNVKDGLFQFFNDAGYLKYSEEYRNDVRHGVSKVYYLQPQIHERNIDAEPRYRSDETVPVRWIKAWKSDKLDGQMKLFAKDGSLLAEFLYGNKEVQEHSKINFEEAFNRVKMNSTEEELLFDDLISLLFIFEDFDQIEALATKFRLEKSRLLSGVDKLDEMYQGLNDGFGEIVASSEVPYLDILNRWITKYPDSITPRILLVHAYKDIAWKYRGRGYAETISEEGIRKFHEYIQKAYVTAKDAMQLESQDPELYNAMIFVGLGASLPKSDLYDFLSAGRSVDPGYFPPYRSMTSALLPRWGGRPGELEDFINWVQGATQESYGFQLYAVNYSAVRDYVGNRTIREHKYDWKKLKNGFEEILAAYPESFYYLNEFAFFSTEQGDRELAKKLFEKIGNRWDSVSERIWTTKAFFDERRGWASGQTTLKQDKLLLVADAKDAALVQKVASKTEDINIVDVSGQTPLMIAISYRKISSALILIEQGARLDIQDKDRREAIHLAAEISSDELFNKLLSKGAGANHADIWGYTPLHYAARSGFDSHVKTLLAIKNVNINSKTNSGKTALHLAAGAGHIDVTDELLKSALIDVNAVTDEDQTPLHYAAMKGFPRIVKILLENSADKTLKDKQGKTAADYAKENRFDEVLKLLSQD